MNENEHVIQWLKTGITSFLCLCNAPTGNTITLSNVDPRYYNTLKEYFNELNLEVSENENSLSVTFFGNLVVLNKPEL